MLITVVMSLGIVLGIAILLNAIITGSRRQRAGSNADGGVAYMSHGGGDCDSGSDAGCGDGGCGGDGGGGGGGGD